MLLPKFWRNLFSTHKIFSDKKNYPQPRKLRIFFVQNFLRSNRSKILKFSKKSLTNRFWGGGIIGDVIFKNFKEVLKMKKFAIFLLAVFAIFVVLPVTNVEARMCYRCDGKGYIEKYEGDYHKYGETVTGRGSYRETCPDCHGSGYKD